MEASGGALVGAHVKTGGQRDRSEAGTDSDLTFALACSRSIGEQNGSKLTEDSGAARLEAELGILSAIFPVPDVLLTD